MNQRFRLQPMSPPGRQVASKHMNPDHGSPLLSHYNSRAVSRTELTSRELSCVTGGEGTHGRGGDKEADVKDSLESCSLELELDSFRMRSH
jgi:hypothetical protein